MLKIQTFINAILFLNILFVLIGIISYFGFSRLNNILYMLYSHDHPYKHISMQNHNDTIKTSDTVLRKIYLSLFWKGCVWEGVGNRTELRHIDPHSIGPNRVYFPFSWAAQPGTWGPSLSGTCSHSIIFSPTRLISKLIIRGPEAPLCWVLAFSTASCHQLIEFPVHWVI